MWVIRRFMNKLLAEHSFVIRIFPGPLVLRVSELGKSRAQPYWWWLYKMTLFFQTQKQSTGYSFRATWSICDYRSWYRNFPEGDKTISILLICSRSAIIWPRGSTGSRAPSCISALMYNFSTVFSNLGMEKNGLSENHCPRILTIELGTKWIRGKVAFIEKEILSRARALIHRNPDFLTHRILPPPLEKSCIRPCLWVVESSGWDVKILLGYAYEIG